MLRPSRVSPGPTELISGFYLVGGPLRRFSTPGCRGHEPETEAGTLQVLNATTGMVLATGSATVGHPATVPLPVGSYTVEGTFEGATVNGAHPTRTITVQILAGHTVRQNFLLQIP